MLEIPGVFGPPRGPIPHAKRQGPFIAEVRTPAEPWAYGAQFPLRTRNLKGPLWVRIQASVKGGSVGFGILNLRWQRVSFKDFDGCFE